MHIKTGKADDTARELVIAAGKIYPDAPVTAIVTGSGSELDAVCNEMAAFYKEVWKFDNEALAYPNAEAIRKLLVNVLPRMPWCCLPHDTFGMDLGPGLSIKLDSVFVSDVVGFEGVDGDTLKVVRQEFSGQVSTHSTCDISGRSRDQRSAGCISSRGSRMPPAVRWSINRRMSANLAAGRRFLEVVAAEVGDVDITKEDVLVSVGRGIEDQDNIEIADELAEAIGAVVSCSRPIVDAKWLEKSRQVGTSGQTVKPKVYLALGISGSFQHLGGLKGNPYIVAVNKNPKAPIFQVADVGVVEDLLEFVPVLTEKIQEG